MNRVSRCAPLRLRLTEHCAEGVIVASHGGARNEADDARDPMLIDMAQTLKSGRLEDDEWE
jgi:hypothetical protein